MELGWSTKEKVEAMVNRLQRSCCRAAEAVKTSQKGRRESIEEQYGELGGSCGGDVEELLRSCRGAVEELFGGT